jgi:hypothetical protein
MGRNNYKKKTIKKVCESDLAWICEEFSHSFHWNCPGPDYQINIFSNHGREWGTVDLDGPAKLFDEFFKVRIAHFLKKNLFYKAQRAHQSEIISQLLANILYHRINDDKYKDFPLTHKNRQIKSVSIQTLTVKGHNTPRLDEMDFLLPKVHEFEVIQLLDTEDKPIYVDLCGPQVDIFVYGSNERPLLILDNLSEGLKVKEPYSKDYRPFIKVTELGKKLEITGDEQWHKFQDAFLSNNIDDIIGIEEKGEESHEDDLDESTEDSEELEMQQRIMSCIENIQKHMEEKLSEKYQTNKNN